MRRVLLLIIHIYWLIPKSRRRKCVFKQSCSVFVYHQAKTNGLLAGIKALKLRRKQCRPGYSFYTTDDKKEWVILNDSTVVERAVTNV